MTHPICIIYLYRTTHPVSDFERFVKGLLKTTKPWSSCVCILIKGATSPNQAQTISSAVEEISGSFETRLLHLNDAGVDISAYTYAAKQTRNQFLCFLNTYSEPLIEGWLDKLAAPVLQGKAGVSGASGAYETTLPETFFPNPSLRTNAFCIARSLYLDLRGVDAPDRQAALVFENGRDSMTRQILERGMRVVVVNGNGEYFDIDRCNEANAFRSLGPQNLLVADNRTREYDNADEEGKARLRRFAWGGSKPRWRLIRSALSKGRRLLGLA